MVRNYKRKTEDRWSKQDLLDALTSIKETKLKVNEASQQFGISRATLYRQYHKFQQAGGLYDLNQFRTCGGNPILTRIEEDVLEKTILDLRDQGFSVTSSDIKRICYEYCDSNGIPNQFNTDKRMASDDWYYGFLKRHPNVKAMKTEDGASTSPGPSESTIRVAIKEQEKAPEKKASTSKSSKAKKSSRSSLKKATKRLLKKSKGRKEKLKEKEKSKGKSRASKGRSRKKAGKS